MNSEAHKKLGLTPILGLAMAVALSFSHGRRATADEAFEEAAYMKTVAQAGVAEGAASHGSLGMRISAGISRLPQTTHSLPKTGTNGLVAGQSPILQRVWLAKGLTLPINVGVILSSLPEVDWLAVTSYAQWSVYESLARPAVAIRGIYTKSFGLQQSEVSSGGIESLVSYGFLRYFAVFGGFGLKRHSAAIYHSSPDQTTLNGQPLIDAQQTSWLSTSSELGFQMTIFPGLAAFSIATTQIEGNQAIHTAKVSVAL